MVSSLVAAIVLAPVELKVMTYNIRYGTANDGVNAWPNRREALIGLIKKHDPDVLGVQEALAGQIDELKAALPEHEVLGVGRDDGIRKGEYSAIFTRRSKLGLREGGTRWISDEPLRPGSLAFDAKITRVFTWGDYFTPGGTRILLMNCHLDHQSEKARLLGARQMQTFAASRGLETLIMGDFNSSQTDAPIKTLLDRNDFGNSVKLPGEWINLAASVPKNGPWGTFNGFKPTQTDGPMIDHIFYSKSYELDRSDPNGWVSKGWELMSVEIDRTLVNGRVPSDHFPVIARFKLPTR